MPDAALACKLVVRAAVADWLSRHPDAPVGGASPEMALVKSWNELLLGLLQREVSYKPNGAMFPEAKLGGQRFLGTKWSQGQKVLLAWAAGWFADSVRKTQAGKPVPPMGDSLIIVDEPELFLHPSACIEVLQKLRGMLGEHGQIWLATHSPVVISAFPDASLYWVEDGGLKYAGTKYTEVLDGLLGGAEGRQRLGLYLGEADQVQAAHFVVSCLKDALVADVSTDAQSKQFTELLSKLSANGHPLRVLDYASGKARFARALSELEESERPHIEYFTYDAEKFFESEKNERLRNLQRLFGTNAQSRMLNNLAAHCTAEEDAKFDLVIMCNVLHEIPPKDWFNCFEEIGRASKGNGFLVIMEDQKMSVGEMPHEQGFLVLNYTEVVYLFQGAGDLGEKMDDKKRCSVVLVPMSKLPSLDDKKKFADQQTSAFRQLQKRARESIEDIRKKSKAELTAEDGLTHARMTMLFANASLALGN